MRIQLLAFIIVIHLLLLSGRCVAQPGPVAAAGTLISKTITLDAGSRYQVIDGFGANITPAQWRNGNLKPVLDSLVDDLGGTLFRFDCYGLANWLDPSKENADGTFPAEYLKTVYTSPTFRDAWSAFRYLNSKGIEPVFNISGAVPYAWTAPYQGKHDRLKNFKAYAAMAASLLVWAREKEGLKFSLFMPFNETDLGFPEGPRLLDKDCVPALEAMLKALAANKLGDLKCIVMDDANVALPRIQNITTIARPERIKGIGVHTYGNGSEEDNRGGWYDQESQYSKAKSILQTGNFKDKSFLLTEYGDLDQSEEIEFEAGWRSTRRLLKCLNDGMSGGIVWDAFDNYHVHDATWALYGLFKTDTATWLYTPKPRYYAAKQVYKYVRPGFRRIAVLAPEAHPDYVFKQWKNTLRNMLLSAFTSADGKNFTLVGTSNIEASVELNIDLKGFDEQINDGKAFYYRTSNTEQFRMIDQVLIKNNALKIIVPAHSIFTVTTLSGR